MEKIMNFEEKITSLRRELSRHARLYYVYDAPEISDYDYDMMYAELLRLEAEHPELYPESDEEFEVVMRDDVTDRQRLEEIKKQNNID